MFTWLCAISIGLSVYRLTKVERREVNDFWDLLFKYRKCTCSDYRILMRPFGIVIYIIVNLINGIMNMFMLVGLSTLLTAFSLMIFAWYIIVFWYNFILFLIYKDRTMDAVPYYHYGNTTDLSTKESKPDTSSHFEYDYDGNLNGKRKHSRLLC